MFCNIPLSEQVLLARMAKSLPNGGVRKDLAGGSRRRYTPDMGGLHLERLQLAFADHAVAAGMLGGI